MAALDERATQFLHRLLECPSPSGAEQPLQRMISAEFKNIAHDITADSHGNLILGLNTKAECRVMVASHCDQIGFMVKHITDGSFLQVEPIGGTDSGVLQGSRVVIWTGQGPVQGIFGRKPIHLQSDSELTQVPRLKQMWIDIGAKDRLDAE